jgi:hypothetical protein
VELVLVGASAVPTARSGWRGDDGAATVVPSREATARGAAFPGEELFPLRGQRDGPTGGPAYGPFRCSRTAAEHVAGSRLDSEDGMERPTSTILLPSGTTFMRPIEFPDGSRGATQDGAYLSFIASELISRGAANLAIAPWSLFYRAVEQMPAPLRRRIKRVDVHLEGWEKARFVMEPVARELGMEAHGLGGYSYVHLPAGTSVDEQRLKLAVAGLTTKLHLVLVGFEHHVQVDAQPQAMLDHIDVLKGGCSRPESHIALASIASLAGSYTAVDLPALVYRSTALPDVIDEFDRFVSDETYRAMSEDMGLLGLPARATHALVQLRGYVDRLLRKPWVAESMDLGARAAEVATHAPSGGVPAALRRVVREDAYFPPLVSLLEAELAAAKVWRSSKPPLIRPPGLPHHLEFEAVDDEAAWDELFWEPEPDGSDG